MSKQVGLGKIAGIGVDMLHIDRIERVYARHGLRFVERILGRQEIEKFQNRYQRDPGRGMRFLASRFAAKEAFSKAIGTGMHSPMTWTRMQTLNESGGKPRISLDEPLAAWCSERFGAMHISITDENDSVVAFVVIETGPDKLVDSCTDTSRGTHYGR